MNTRIELDLDSGGHFALELEPPGNFPSSYFIFMKYAGHSPIWPFVKKILAAARHPVCHFDAPLKKGGSRWQDVTDDSLRRLFLTDGYCIGVIWDVRLMPIELDRMGRKTFLFVSDPREMAARSLEAADLEPDADFLRSPIIDNIANQFRSAAEFCRRREHVKIVRFEDVAFGWARLAVDLVEILGLQIARDTALAIAQSAQFLVRHSPVSTFLERFDRTSLAALEERFAEAMAYFGYAPMEGISAAFAERHGEFLQAISDRLSMVSFLSPGAPAAAVPKAPEPAAPAPIPESDATVSAVNPPLIEVEGIFESDPELLRRLKPNASTEITVLGRRVVMDVDAYGCRPVTGQPASGTKTLAIYGCSFTYGVALPAEETFCSLLQAAFPDWRVENHGVSGYSTLRNLTQLERNSRWDAADYVTFCWISSHLVRNVGEINWLRHSMRNMRPDHPARLYPRAALDENGDLAVRTVKLPRWDLMGVDLSDFSPDQYYLDLVCAAIFRRARDIVAAGGGHFFVTILKGQMSSALRRLLHEACIPFVDTSLNDPEYTCRPDDGHPNTLASQIYAAKIREYLICRETP